MVCLFSHLFKNAAYVSVSVWRCQEAGRTRAVYGVIVTVHCDNTDSKYTLRFLFPCATDSIFPFQQVRRISNVFCFSEENSSFVSESGKVNRYFCNSYWELLLGKTVCSLLFVTRSPKLAIKWIFENVLRHLPPLGFSNLRIPVLTSVSLNVLSADAIVGNWTL